MKIMVADDEELIVDLLSEYLTAAGHEVSSAFDADSLVAAVQADPPELIFLDINMPGIREGGMANPKVTLPDAIKNIPIVAVTGNEAKKVYQMGLPANIEVLSKPINFPDIDAIIAKYTA